MGAVLVAATLAGSLYVGTGANAEAPSYRYTVKPGDTLWSIATEHYESSEDPRANIESIREESGLEGYVIRPGMRLDLPR